MRNGGYCVRACALSEQPGIAGLWSGGGGLGGVATTSTAVLMRSNLAAALGTMHSGSRRPPQCVP